MNNFKIKLRKNEAGEVVGPNTVYMKLSAELEQDGTAAAFRARYDLPILQGRRKVYADGSCAYWFEVNEKEGRELIQALTMASFMPNEN